jgi:hypothetical protein
MGIPKLMRDLAPYTERASLGKQLQFEVAVSVVALVIDGPSFVYEVYRRQMRSVSQLKAPIAYRDINDAVVDLLDEIQSRGVEMCGKSYCEVFQLTNRCRKKIYFDGALPESKRATRLERLEKHRQELESFTKMQVKKVATKDAPQQPARGKALLQALASSPAHTPKALEPPFMVASAIEHLRQSAYSSVIDLIPDEAEAGCVMYACRKPGVAMLSSDTDLVVFPYASVQGVTLVLLRTLQEAGPDPGKSVLMADCLRPWEISRRLKISSLDLLAYQRYVNPSASSAVIRRAARTASTVGKMSLDFLAEYGCRKEVEEALSAPSCSVHLDPRLAELRSQYRGSRHAIGVLLPMQMYLPALFEDPSRESPWQYGADLRQLAYSLLNFSVPSKLRRANIIEFQRRGFRIGGRVVELLNKKSLLQVFGEDTSLLQHVPISESGAVTMKLWQKLALQAVNKRRGEDGRFTFLPAIHLSACIQAVLYSLRLLKQVAELLSITAPTSQLIPPDLLEKLTTMPSLAELMDTTQEMYPPK